MFHEVSQKETGPRKFSLTGAAKVCLSFTASNLYRQIQQTWRTWLWISIISELELAGSEKFSSRGISRF